MAKKLKQHHKDKLLVLSGIALILLLLLWWAAAHYHWGPYRIKSTTPTTSSVAPGASSSSSAAGGTGATGASGTSGASGSNGTNGTTTPPAPAGAGTPIFNLYGSVYNGENKTDVGSSSGGLDPNCTTLTSTPGSKQEVCTYQSGDKVVTITYLNDQVASVSKSGF